LSKDHGRTLDAEKYNQHIETFQANSGPLLENNYTDRILRLQNFLDNRKRSHWASIPNRILALVDAIYKDHMEKFAKELRERAAAIEELQKKISQLEETDQDSAELAALQSKDKIWADKEEKR
jgi:hypothetical protein